MYNGASPRAYPSSTRRSDIKAVAISIVIPVLNEQDRICASIAGIRRLDGGGDCEIIVVDGDDNGATLAAIEDDGVIKVTADRGRSRQMNAGAALAHGDVIVFLHADTVLPDTAFSDIAAALHDPSLVGGAFAHRFDSRRFIYRLMSAAISIATRLSRLPYGDQGVFIRRNYFEAIGGFAPIEIMEDQELARRIRRRGGRMRVLKSRAHTSCRRLEEEGIVRRVLKNWFMTALYAAGISPQRLIRFYRPHGDSGTPDEPRRASESLARRPYKP